MKPHPASAEKRFHRAAELRVKPTADGSPSTTLVGYALKYNSLSEDLGGFKEVIKPGAFTESLKTADVRALIDHDPGKILGRNTAGTLRLADDEVGLAFEIDVDPRLTYAADLMISVDRRDKDQCSFGFFCDECDWELYSGDPNLVLRSIIAGRIFDVSIVTFPAYVDTTAAMRSLDPFPELKAVALRTRDGAKTPPTPPIGLDRTRQLRNRLSLNRQAR